MSKLIVNCATGKTSERDLNKSEKDQQKIDEALHVDNQIIVDETAAKRQLILDKLGLTSDEAKLLIG